jgi:spore maturation protein CgeB
VPFETYVPFSWNAEDLLEKAEYYLHNERERKRIAANAYESYRQQVARVEQKVESILSLVRL